MGDAIFRPHLRFDEMDYSMVQSTPTSRKLTTGEATRHFLKQLGANRPERRFW
jgi:hypothetical protein